MSDSELGFDSDQDVSESHSKLIDAVSQLDKGQRVRKPERSEPSLEVSEFHLVKSGISDKDAIHLHDLAKSLGNKGHHADVTKGLQSAKKKTKLLSKPLEKPAADRIKRIVGFENTTKEVRKWNAVITQNRTAESMRFPLNQPSMKLEPSNQFLKRFRIQSDLEKELAALEPQKENVVQEKDEFSMTLQEIMEKRKEAAKLRAQQSYKEAKANRQKKIKSKKFHRVQRKEKIKLQLKEFENLQKTDPAAALEKLEELDKTRAEERMSLRHKSTGQWAKNLQIRAKYDKDTRQVLAQQLAISRDLTQKIKNTENSDDEYEHDSAPAQITMSDKENPWVVGTKTEAEIDEFIQSYRKYWDEKNKKSEDQPSNTNTQTNEKTQEVEALKKHAENNINQTATSNVVKDVQDAKSHGEATEITQSKGRKLPKVVSIQIIDKKQNIIPNGIEPIKLLPETTPANDESLSKINVSGSLYATSSWTVEPVDATFTETWKEKQERARSTSRLHNFEISNLERINELFDNMEDKMQTQVESKLEIVKRQYDTTTNDIKSKNNRRGKKEDNQFDDDQFDGLGIKAKKQKPLMDEAMNETKGEGNSAGESNSEILENAVKIMTIPGQKAKSSEAEIDPNKYINVKPKHLYTNVPDLSTAGEEALDDSEEDEEKHNIISEAFADDDVVEDFRKEKQEEIDKSKPQNIDLTLPGWGSWGGKNVRVSRQKKRRFMLKFPKDAPRKDENKGDVVIIEENNAKIRQHQVAELPYPFTSVKDFEASVRMPLGRNFVPENAHRRLIEPTVKTSIGKVIEPMDEDILVKLPERKRKHFNNNKNGAKHKKKENQSERDTSKK